MSAQLDLFQTVPLDKLKTSPDNVRQHPGDVKDLASSIAAVGILEPLVVVATDDGFEVVAGSRRLAAAREAGLHDAPVVVRDLNDGQRVEASIIENLQRQELPPLDEARGYQRLIALSWRQNQIAERVGVSQAHVSRRLALLKLPDDVQAKVAKGSIVLEDAFTLTQLADDPKRLLRVVKTHEARGYDKIHNLVDRELRAIKVERTRAPVIEKLRDRGIRVLPEFSVGWSGKRKACADVGVDTKKHAKDFPACHAAVVDERGTIAYVCTNPSVHQLKGAKAKGAPKDRWQAEREKREAEQKRWDEAREGRETFVAALLKKKLAMGDVLELTVLTAMHATDVSEPGDAAKLLGLTRDDGGIEAYAGRGERELVAAAAALAYSSWGFDGYGAERSAACLQWLVERGYAPADVERETLDAATKAEAKAAKKAAKADA